MKPALRGNSSTRLINCSAITEILGREAASWRAGHLWARAGLRDGLGAWAARSDSMYVGPADTRCLAKGVDRIMAGGLVVQNFTTRWVNSN